jgi:hypothetical protein
MIKVSLFYLNIFNHNRNIIPFFIQFKNPLTQAFVTGNLENFKRLLSNGESNKEMDEATGISVFEKLCRTPKSSEFIRVCLHKFATDPNFLLNHFMPTEVSRT